MEDIWFPVTNPPPLTVELWVGRLSSKPVLGYCKSGHILVVTLEKYEDDEAPTWYSNCSEKWTLTDVLYWVGLPEPPL